jgi:hypothetical protein
MEDVETHKKLPKEKYLSISFFESGHVSILGLCVVGLRASEKVL